jgi:type I restriction enzyme S subunit
VDSRFINHALTSAYEAGAFNKFQTETTNLRNLNVPAFLENTKILLAPLAEQRRIVAKLEQLLARLDACDQRLTKAAALLDRFRRSVLAAACSGKLTADWRLENPDIERVDKLLVKSNDFRKANVDAANANAGFRRFRYVDAARIELGGKTKGIDELFELPDTWEWASLGQLTWSIADGPHFSPKYVNAERGVPFISGRNVSYAGIDFSDAKYVSRKDHEAFSKRAQPLVGDVLLTKGGTTGISTVVTESRDFSIWVHVALLKVVTQLVSPFYLRDVLSTPFVYRQSQAQTHGVGNQDLGLTRMVHMALPLPPKAEQEEIVRRVGQLLAVAERLQARLDTAKTQLNRAPSSLRAKAFRGELVPTEAELAAREGRDYEPASVLLARILREREIGKVRPTMRPRARQGVKSALPAAGVSAT